MKTLIAYSTIALGTVLFTFGPAHAFFDDGNGNTAGGIASSTTGNATGEGEGTFGMTFEGNGSTSGSLNGNTVGRASDASDTKGSVTGFGDGRADAKGGAKFSMHFTGRAKADGDFKSDQEGSMQNMFSGENREYYYRPVK
jgi:hypothetical protein